jgi:hypothetical protein
VSRYYRLPYLGPCVHYHVIIIASHILILRVLEIINCEGKDLADLFLHRVRRQTLRYCNEAVWLPKEMDTFLTVCKLRSVVPHLFIVITVAESKTRVNTTQTDQQY